MRLLTKLALGGALICSLGLSLSIFSAQADRLSFQAANYSTYTTYGQCDAAGEQWDGAILAANTEHETCLARFAKFAESRGSTCDVAQCQGVHTYRDGLIAEKPKYMERCRATVDRVQSQCKRQNQIEVDRTSDLIAGYERDVANLCGKAGYEALCARARSSLNAVKQQRLNAQSSLDRCAGH